MSRGSALLLLFADGSLRLHRRPDGRRVTAELRGAWFSVKVQATPELEEAWPRAGRCLTSSSQLLREVCSSRGGPVPWPSALPNLVESFLQQLLLFLRGGEERPTLTTV